MTSLQETKPRQIRALLLLLILAPLMPTGLLLRFMFDTVQQERESARETIANAWQDTLTIAVRSLGSSLKPEVALTRDRFQAAKVIAAALQHSFEHEVRVRILASDQTLLAGSPHISGRPVASTSIGGLLPGASVELFLVDRSFVKDAVQNQIDTYTQTAVITITANLLIALLAGWAFLRQIQNQELRSTSLATLAHELRTPVASMRLLLDTIQEGRCPDRDEYIELVARENARLARLVDQFLTHSRLELGVGSFIPKPVAPARVVAQAEENLGGRLRASGCSYHSDLEANLPEISGNAEALTCMVDNLFDNAWKYTGPEKQITLRVSRQSGGVEFAILDNGIGILAEDQKAIFDRFHQIDNRLARTAEGCGLGLNIVKRIVEMHHGRIRVESSLGKGSCFRVWLPAVKST